MDPREICNIKDCPHPRLSKYSYCYSHWSMSAESADYEPNPDTFKCWCGNRRNMRMEGCGKHCDQYLCQNKCTKRSDLCETHLNWYGKWNTAFETGQFTITKTCEEKTGPFTTETYEVNMM